MLPGDFFISLQAYFFGSTERKSLACFGGLTADRPPKQALFGGVTGLEIFLHSLLQGKLAGRM